MKNIDTRIAIITLLLTFGCLLVGIKQCQLAQDDNGSKAGFIHTDIEAAQVDEQSVKDKEPTRLPTHDKSLSQEKNSNNEPIDKLVPAKPTAPSTSDTETFIYTGTIVDKSSKPLEGIRVSFEGQEVVSKTDGTFKLNIPKSLKEPRITLSVDGESYPPYENPTGTIFVFPPN